MTRLVSSLSQRIAAGVVFAGLGAVGFLPLFGGPGYEHALASGVVVPSAAAIATALDLSTAKDPPPIACAGRGLASGAALAGIAFFTALLHGLRVGICDFWGGAILFALTAGAGALVGGVWGAIVAELTRGRRRRRLASTCLAIAGPLACVVVSLARFYGSPAIFSYDPFFGYFSGTPYDTIVDVRPELWTYRAGTLATLAAIVLLAAAFERRDDGVRRFGHLRRVRGDAWATARLVLGLCALALSLTVSAEGEALGHRQSASSIARALGGRASGPRCDVFYPDSLVPDQAALIVRDCEEELAADEEKLGAHLDGRLTAFVFEDANQKRALMGAAQTSIAKPWRKEVYIQASVYPHPILGHEIAHVVSGSFGRGPFRVAGGIWPNPGLIEGIAVATSPDDDELTDAQWARAMLDLGILGPTRSLFSLDFLGQNADKSYTVAGAFVGWVLDRWGADAVRAWYGGASIEALTGRTWSQLDDDFRAMLRALRMPEGATTYARARFERPSVWSRTCPHVVDTLNHAADKCIEERRFARAGKLYDDALALDARDWHALLARSRLDLNFGDAVRGRRVLEGLDQDPKTPRILRDRVEDTLADDDLRHDRDAPAVATYRTLAERTLDEDFARTLEVKAIAGADPVARQAIVDLLIGEAGRPVNLWVAGMAVGVWGQDTHAPVAEYLIGKNLASHDEWTRAATWLDRAIDAGAPTLRVGRELLRQRAICACALRDGPAIARVKGAVVADASPFANTAGGRKAWVLSFIARCSASGDGGR